MARNSQQTREQLIASAVQLILSKGFVATSIADICQQCAVSKGSFFHYFRDKKELAAAVVTYFSNNMVTLLKQGDYQYRRTAKGRLLGFIDYLIGLSENKVITQGCVIGIIAQELAATDPYYRHLVQVGFSPGKEIISNLVRAAQKETGKKLDCNAIADYFLTIVQGSLLLVRSTGDETIMTKNLKQFRKHLNQLL